MLAKEAEESQIGLLLFWSFIPYTLLELTALLSIVVSYLWKSQVLEGAARFEGCLLKCFKFDNIIIAIWYLGFYYCV